ncbi:UbiD family decarboxylase [Colletotrichum kahawae]|uniref:UbiD family decarboxylase n=1 Tax=Colletotrichum kahawae TaxID=34407 RepID=A0AAD9XWY8_COLKA|nr:UbiD family decarboxylase [Colletotrichum kahawae]
MDPDACRNCGHSGKHTTFLDHRCAIHERDDAERDKLQADAALERARSLCETSLTLMKRQMQELEDANEAIAALAASLAAAEDRRERVRRDLGAHGDVCLTARSNLEAAEEMAIAAAGRYFEAGRAVSALEEREALEAKSSEPSWEREHHQLQEDQEGEGEGEEGGDARRWQRSNERFCKWLRQSEAQRQIMKSSWTKLRVAERLAGEGAADVDEEQVARERRVQEWAAARRSDLPPDEDPTLVTEEGDAESEPVAPVVAVAVTVPPTPAATRSGAARRAAAPAPLKTRGRSGRTATAAAAAAAAAPVTAPPSPTKTTTTTTGRALRTARRVESQTRSEPSRPTTATRAKKEPVTANQKAAATRVTRAARTGKTAAAAATEAVAVAGHGASAGSSGALSASGRPQRVTRRRSRVQPRWK